MAYITRQTLRVKKQQTLLRDWHKLSARWVPIWLPEGKPNVIGDYQGNLAVSWNDSEAKGETRSHKLNPNRWELCNSGSAETGYLFVPGTERLLQRPTRWRPADLSPGVNFYSRGCCSTGRPNAKKNRAS